MHHEKIEHQQSILNTALLTLYFSRSKTETLAKINQFPTGGSQLSSGVHSQALHCSPHVH